MRLLIGLLAILPCCAQDHFHVDVRLVNVSFAVRDSSGALMSNLTRDDFEVIDDGVPQTISSFSRGADLPLTLGLVADFSGSQEHFIKQHQRDLERFLQHVLSPADRAFLLCFGNHLRLASDLTPSTQQLIDGLERFQHGKSSFVELGPPDIRVDGTAFYDSLYYSTTLKLASAPGARKALIIFSDGEDNSSAHHMLDAIESAQTENVVIFGIRYTESKKGHLTARNKYGMRGIERICHDTGGVDFDGRKADLNQAFDQIGEELRSSYELAYHSNHPPGDATFHKLVIRAKQPGLIIRTKTGYFAKE
jgi:Ca-activated chloride channel family protein